jgi:hypothetical protein
MLTAAAHPSTESEWNVVRSFSFLNAVVSCATALNPLTLTWMRYAASNGAVYLLHQDGKATQAIPPDETYSRIQSLVAQGDTLVVARGFQVEFWRDGRNTATIACETKPTSLAFNNAGVVAFSSGPTLQVWSDPTTLVFSHRMDSLIQSVSISKEHILAHSSNRMVVLNTASMEIVTELASNSAMYACSAVGRTRALLGCEDGNCLVVEVTSNKVHQLFGHSNRVRSVSLSRCVFYSIIVA